MESLLKDVHFAFRTLRRQRSFTITAVITLALGIGATTAIFSIVESTLLRPLPFRTPEQLVFAWGVAGPQRSVRGASYIEARDWARLAKSFDDISILDQTSLSLRTSDGARRIPAEMVSASFFKLVGATPQLGRTFRADEDDVPMANPVVVMSDALWRSEYGADPTVIGRTLTLNDVSFQVLGVMAPGFKGLSFNADLWFPAAMVQANGGPRNLADRGNRWLGAVARLRDGVTLTQAQEDADRVAGLLTKEFPDNNADRGIQLFTLTQNYLGSTQQLLLAVFAGVGLLLLIACANVAGLQLVRASARAREMALRRAIGAGQGRLVQQTIIEGAVLSLVAAVIGLLFANWGLAGLLLLVPQGTLPAYAEPSINTTAFAFTLVLALAAGVAFGLVPALRGRNAKLADTLRDGSRGSSSGLGARLGPQQILVMTQTSFALVLLVGAGLFTRSLQRELGVSLGFESAGVLRTSVNLPAQYTPDQRVKFVEQVQAQIASIPGVTGVSVASGLPLDGVLYGSRIWVPETQQSFRFYRYAVTSEYFDMLHIPLIEGRRFSTTDRIGAPTVIAVNQSTAKRFWPNESAIGKHLRAASAEGEEFTVVAVVADVRNRDLRTSLSTSEPDIYFAMGQRPFANVAIAIQTNLPAASIQGPARRILTSIDAGASLTQVRPLQFFVDAQTATGRFASAVLAVFSLTAVMLSAVGLYAVLAYLVSLRRREIGIRIALGATPTGVMRRVVGQGVAVTAGGVVLGLVATSLVMRLIASQLYGVPWNDAVVLTTVTVTLLGVAALASWLPARRAARVDPQLALRLE